MFEPVESNADFPAQELAICQFWKQQGVYAKSLEQRANAPPFVFYEGPPTANGKPHPGHCLTRTIKDVFPRYRTMRGFRCERKAGWDTHGLPVEVEVCKELGIHSKEEIETYGIEPFIQKCQQSVWRYMQEWEQVTERIGFWVDLDDAYVTYHQSYVESVWWSLKTLFDRGLLYQGHKIVWWWAQGGTALSAGEVGQGYREVADPSVFVRFPLVSDRGVDTKVSLLVWTTTPWTLPSNQFAAVHPDLEYATVVDTGIETGESQKKATQKTLGFDEPAAAATTGGGEKLIIAADLVETIAAKLKRELVVESTCRGSELVGQRYRPPFDYYYKTYSETVGTLTDGSVETVAWRVVAADFVTTDSGSGVVHQAPAFGEVDYDVLIAEQQRYVADEGPQLICAVGPDGKFTEEAPDYQGRWVKEADKDILRDLKDRGLLFLREQYLHDYPFCWRADEDPLIQYPRRSWFIRTTDFKDTMLANNQKVNWLPEHIKDGRFGKFLESNVDWALSRERYWGTPLPIWVCEETGQMEAVASYEELLAKPGAAGSDVWDAAKKKTPDLPDDLRVHKPYIDAVTYDSPFATGARMRRVTEVIDCWYDSGAMPFAQWGYPHQGVEQFHDQFPADFISEAIDQTRGWFYSQLAISTLLFGKRSEVGGQRSETESPPSPLPLPPSDFPHPFRNCIVLGLMLGEDGQKMSKSKRNYREPREIFDRYGADALRWYFLANQPPWTSIRYSEQAIKDSIPEFLLRLRNVYSFFVIYANIDGFDPASDWSLKRPVQGSEPLNSKVFAASPTHRPATQRGELDRWILSELHSTVAAVVEAMDAYDNFAACGRISEFVDALSNWYVRRSRDRFWAADKQSPEKLDAYWTLYECLLTTSRLIAPFVPFLAETIWQNLAGVFKGSAAESVHLCDFPSADDTVIDEALSERMNLVRHIASLGRNARNAAELKVRQPLSKVEVILANTTHQSWLEEHASVIADELNVKQVEFSDEPDKYVEHEVLPNFKLLGPKVGKLMPKVKQELARQSGAELLANIRDNGKINLTIDGQEVELTGDEVEVRIKAKPGWAAANDKGVVVVLSTELTPELIAEGLARDAIRVIQDRRKETGCDFTDRIQIGLIITTEELRLAIEQHRETIQQETLAESLSLTPIGSKPVDVNIGGHLATLFIRVVTR
jgi:isoleucyl-tRNA synthetase